MMALFTTRRTPECQSCARPWRLEIAEQKGVRYDAQKEIIAAAGGQEAIYSEFDERARSGR